VIWMSGTRSRAVIGESYNLPAADVALLPVGAAAPGPLYAARLSVVWVTTRPVPRASQPLWVGRLAVGAGCLVGGVRQPTVREGATADHTVPLRQRMRAARKLLFGPARTAGG
jgi:hypothetical protein